MKYDPSARKTSIVQYSAAAQVRRSIAPCTFVGQDAPTRAGMASAQLC